MTGTWLYLTEAAAGELQSLHRTTDLSVVHYAASVSDKTFPQAAQGLLKSMGKDENVTGMRMHPSDGVNVLPVWLTAHETRVVVLSRTQSWQRPQVLTELIRLLAATPATVVVATDPGIPHTVASALRGMCPTPAALDVLPDLVASLTGSPHSPNEADAQAPVRVDVPTSDWATFRYDCRNSLSPAAFEWIDAAYRDAFTTARALLADSPPTNESTRDLLTSILHTSQDTAVATAAFRASQAAYFQSGYNLRLDPTRLISLYAYTRPPSFTERDWTALRAYRDPARPAACTLHAHGLTITEIKTFTLGAAEAALTSRTLNGRPLNRHAATYLTANLLQRGIQGAARDDVFIALKDISHVLTAAGKDVGILTAGKPNQTSTHTKAIWTAGTGFLLKEIA